MRKTGMPRWEDGERKGIDGQDAYKVYSVLESAIIRMKDEESKKVLQDIVEAIKLHFHGPK
jgi:hypothetical protein